MDTAEKENALMKWTGSEDLQNRLFFQARNLAIEAISLRIETLFLRAGMDVTVKWRESSFPGVRLAILMDNPKKNQSWEQAEFSLDIERKTIRGPSHLSNCFYSYKHFGIGHWSHKPAVVTKAENLLQELEQTGVLASLVNRVNYPFDYSSFSSF